MAEALRDFTLIGLSHRTAPVEVRERLAIPTAELPGVLSSLRALPGVEECLLVCTCNRVEVYVYGEPHAAEVVKGWLVQRAGPAVAPVLYERRAGESLRHLFRVAASLDSMVLGEPQILGQVKEAFALAQEAGSLGGALTGACQAAFSTAKRVRTETAIGSAPVSMASAAVELARKIFGGLDGRTVLLVGAGKMSELTAKHLASASSRILVTNRTLARAEDLASRVGGRALAWAELPQLLVEADIVVTSTAAPRPVLTVAMLQAAIRARHWRPLFLVDLAVPRDIEPGVEKVENVFPYDVDDLAAVVQDGRSAREEEARKAEAIVHQELDRFLKARQVRDQLPALALLRHRADEIARLEFERTLANCGEELSEKQRKSIEAMGRAIVNKLLHGTTAQLREAGHQSPEEAAALSAIVTRLFDLAPPTEPVATGAPPQAATREKT